ncbi:MAG: hypothetical protein AAGA61_09575 [Pseudomonadota bacterium]
MIDVLRSARRIGVCIAVSAQLAGPTYAAGPEDTVSVPLGITIPVFATGVPEDQSDFRELQIFPRIREIESRLMPFVLRDTLANSGEWGPVRVAMQNDDAAELQVFGTIARSDGDFLDLQIRATDATGRVWLDKVFSGVAAETNGAYGDEFRAVFDSIADELKASRDRLPPAEQRAVRGTSQMRYAFDLAPEVFDEYLEESDDGRWSLLRLPARNDPMLERIERIRGTEFLFTDTIDNKFRELGMELARTYRAWREYRRKFVRYNDENVRFAEANRGDAPRGSWEAIKDQYDAWKYDRVTAQEQDRLAIAFDTEVTPTVEAMEARVAELEEWVRQRSLEWRYLLNELAVVEDELGQ